MMFVMVPTSRYQNRDMGLLQIKSLRALQLLILRPSSPSKVWSTPLYGRTYRSTGVVHTLHASSQDCGHKWIGMQIIAPAPAANKPPASVLHVPNQQAQTPIDQVTDLRGQPQTRNTNRSVAHNQRANEDIRNVLNQRARITREEKNPRQVIRGENIGVDSRTRHDPHSFPGL